jgi:excisionase family DNA binding protein
METSHIERMTIKQAAAMLNVSVDTLRRWDREGRLSPSGRTMSGWRYYLFTDIQTILDDLAFRHQKSLLQKTAALTHETIHALRAAHRVPLRTRSSASQHESASVAEEIGKNTDQQKTSLTEKAQRLLDAVNEKDYIVAIDVLTAISVDLENAAR